MGGGVLMIGVNCEELMTLSDPVKTLTDIRAFGFTAVRFEVAWQLVQPAKGTWNWGVIQTIKAAADKLGITLLPVLGIGHSPSWAWTIADVQLFAAVTAKTLNTPDYEVWNEPNLSAFNRMGQAVTYVPWLNAAFAGIKSVQPYSRVIMGGLSACVTAKGFNWFFWLAPFGPWGNSSPEDFLSAAIAGGAKFDAVAYHPYSIGPGFDVQAPSASQVMLARIPVLQKLVRSPLVLTEWGFDAAKVSSKNQVAWFKSQLALMPGDSYLQCWRDNGGEKFGLVDANNVPREPYYSTVRAALTS